MMLTWKRLNDGGQRNRDRDWHDKRRQIRMKTDRARYKSTIKPSKFENAQRWGLHPARRTSAIQFALLQLFFCLFLSLSLSRSFSLAVCGPRDATIRFCFVSFFFFFEMLLRKLNRGKPPEACQIFVMERGKKKKKRREAPSVFFWQIIMIKAANWMESVRTGRLRVSIRRHPDPTARQTLFFFFFLVFLPFSPIFKRTTTNQHNDNRIGKKKKNKNK